MAPHFKGVGTRIRMMPTRGANKNYRAFETLAGLVISKIKKKKRRPIKVNKLLTSLGRLDVKET